MVYLILDTNIWIYLAEGQHPFVLQGLIQKIDEKEIIILVNDVIIKEWDRNREEIKKRIKKEIEKQIVLAKELDSCFNSVDGKDFNRLLAKISTSSPVFENTIDSRFQVIDDLMKNKSVRVPLKEKDKLTVIDWALNNQAPFHRHKNSVADALILLSSIDYILKEGINTVNYNRIDVSDSVFVSYNSDDFSKDIKGADKNVIHPDLEPFFNSVGMKYERNFGNILNLTGNLKIEIDEYMEYVEYQIIERMGWENENR